MVELFMRILKSIDEKFNSHFGFKIKETTFEKIVNHLHKPAHASSLAVSRILFGLAMLFDIPDERGGAIMDKRWGKEDMCYFPLIPLIRPLSLPFMALVYACLWIGAIGIMIGYKYRISAVIFVICYWYLFIIEKSYWNNHSYLFGLVASLLATTQADRYGSVDAYLDKKIYSPTVPYWNYFVLKYQFFILYFVAGLKKGTAEWLTGYSLPSLGEHWVFDPFKYILSVEQIDYLIVHWFAFLFDLTIAFWIMWSKTRHVAMIFCAAFHLMNIRLFRIGMFPWVCLATMPLFYPFDWPKQVINNILNCTLKVCLAVVRRLYLTKYHLHPEQLDHNEKDLVEIIEVIQINKRCLNDSKENNDKPIESEGDGDSAENIKEEMAKNIKSSFKAKVTTCLIFFYMAIQLFLPYSHFLTQGYNSWTNGLYGYSWDMMVHTWDTTSIVVKIVDNDTKENFYINPDAWTPNARWTRHADMVYQFAHCAKHNIQKDAGTDTKSFNNISIYIDAWASMNSRFLQRMFDYKIDLLKANWSPFEKVNWLMPLLIEADNWRSKLDLIRSEVHSWSNKSDVLFVADFPDYSFESYFSYDLTNITLTSLQGDIAYETEINSDNIGYSYRLSPGQRLRVPSGMLHIVHNIDQAPAFYMYTFNNETLMNQQKNNTITKLHLGNELYSRLYKIFVFQNFLINFLFGFFFRMPLSFLRDFFEYFYIILLR